MNIYIAKNGTQTGPYSEQQVKGMLTGGLVAPTDLARYNESSSWQPLQILLGLDDWPVIPHGRIPVAVPPSNKVLSVGPTGVGGWLSFFCFEITILEPLLAFFWLGSAWSRVEPSFADSPAIEKVIVLENIFTFILSAYGIIVGCIIWSGNRSGRTIAKNYLLICLIISIGNEIFALRMMRDLPIDIWSAGLAGSIRSVFRSIFVFVVWWVYFKVSKRVRNTYGNERA